MTWVIPRFAIPAEHGLQTTISTLGASSATLRAAMAAVLVMGRESVTQTFGAPGVADMRPQGRPSDIDAHGFLAAWGHRHHESDADQCSDIRAVLIDAA